MNMTFLNPPILSSLEERRGRAEKAVHILKTRLACAKSARDNRWKVWVDMHKSMADAMTPEALLNFQSHAQLGPQITGGSGRHFIPLLVEKCGKRAASFFMKNHTETLCGQPRDLVSEQGVYCTVTSMRHLYHVARIHEYCSKNIQQPGDCVEIGGGFGNLCRMMMQYGLCSRYYIVDHPVLQAIQFFFLGEFFPASDIAVLDENGAYVHGFVDSKIQLCSSFRHDWLKDRLKSPYSLVSTLALTEIPPQGQRQYLSFFSPAFMYLYGQLENVAVGPAGRSGKEMQFSNKELVYYLGERFHTIDYAFHGYHFEYMGRSKKC
jgi:hypothetical protein